MKYKKELLLICLLIFLFGIANASAGDVNGTVVANNDQSDNHIDTLNKNAQNDIQAVNQDYLKLSDDVVVNNNASYETKDNTTVNYLVKYKEKYDNIVNKSTKKDRTFKLGKYKLTISKNDYKNFLYAKFMNKYIKSGNNITLLEKIFEINKTDFFGFVGTGVVTFAFPYYSVVKKTDKVIIRKIGMFKDYKTKNFYFKDIKKAKKFNKKIGFKHPIKYDKKLKRYYINLGMPSYDKMISKKARVYIKLQYFHNKFDLTVYTKYDNRYNPITNGIVGDFIYKSSKNINKLNKSKTKKILSVFMIGSSVHVGYKVF